MNFNRNRFKLFKSEATTASMQTHTQINNSFTSHSPTQAQQKNISSSFDSMMRSSNILDDLLRRCKEIGNVKPPQVNNKPIEQKSTTINKKNTSNAQTQSPHLQIKKNLNENANVVTNSSSSIFSSNNVSIKPVMSNVNNVYKLNNTFKPKPKSFSQIYYQPSTVGRMSTNIHPISANTVKESKYKLVKKAETVSKKSSQRLDINVLLGRQVNNISKNKFKFIRNDMKKKANKYTNRYKLTKNVNKLSNGTNARINYRLLLSIRKSNMKKQQLYYMSNRSTRILNIKGSQFKVNKSGLKLKRLNSNRVSSFVSSSIKRAPLIRNKYKLINQNVQNSTAMKSILYAKYCIFWDFFFAMLLKINYNSFPLLFFYYYYILVI
jgi:hypothetical protein